MEQQRQLVGKLRAILGDAIPRHPRNERTLEPVTAAHHRRARARFEIRDIATRYGWQGEVERALVRFEAPSLKYLGIDQLDQVLAQLRSLEECLHTPCDPADSPPAR